eukprot:Colp12_sorted_trinity150504_noHs@13409
MLKDFIFSPKTSSFEITLAAFKETLFYKWLGVFFLNCTKDAVQRSFRASHLLSQYSSDIMKELLPPTAYRSVAKGTLSLYPNAAARDSSYNYITSTLGDGSGLNLRKVNGAEEATSYEPVLEQSQVNVDAALYSPDDTSGDIHMY